MKRASGVLETIKTVILSLLVVSMVALASVYILGTQSERLAHGNDIVFDRLFALKNDVSGGTDSFDHGHILPEIIGIKRDGEAPFAMLANSGYITDMYESIMPYITELFGHSGDCAEFGTDDGDLLWRRCMSSESYVYLRYHSEFPFSVLYVHSKNTDDADIYRSKNDIEGYVYELFFLEEDGSLAIVTRDMRGKVLKFTAGKSSAENFPSFGIYISRCEEFSFAMDEYEDPQVFYGTPILSGNVSTKKIYADNLAGNEFGNTEGDKFRDLMRIFDFNPDKLSAYVDSEDKNASMYVESHGVLRMSVSAFEYTASADGGIPVAGFLSYTNASGYNLYDCLKAAECFADKLRGISEKSFGGDASIGISYIGYRDGVVVVEYSYYYENVLVEYVKKTTAFRFEIAGDRFVGVTARPLSISSSAESVQSFSQKIMLGINKDALSGVSPSHLNMRLKYALGEDSEKGTSAEWEIVAY